MNVNDLVDTFTAGPAAEDSTPTQSTLSLTTIEPNGLGLLSQPTTATAGKPISPAIQVNIVDNDNNTVTTDNTQVVTLSIAEWPGRRQLLGTTTLTAVNGVATFAGLSVSLSGTYVFVATGGDLTPVDTNPITVAPEVITSGVSIRRGPLHVVKRPAADGRWWRWCSKRSRSRIPAGRLCEDRWRSRSAAFSAGDTLSNASGSDDGSPYREILLTGKSLKPGHSKTETLDFVLTGKARASSRAFTKPSRRYRACDRVRPSLQSHRRLTWQLGNADLKSAAPA